MDPELKRQLEEIHALTKDNHHMLRAIRRHQWYSFMSTVVFWLVILVTPFSSGSLGEHTCTKTHTYVSSLATVGVYQLLKFGGSRETEET